jgi:hypothetical protein
MKIVDFIQAKDFSSKALQELFEWATSPVIEESGEGRRQLGFVDGYEGEASSSKNADYLRGYEQGRQMRAVATEVRGDD